MFYKPALPGKMRFVFSVPSEIINAQKLTQKSMINKNVIFNVDTKTGNTIVVC